MLTGFSALSQEIPTPRILIDYSFMIGEWQGTGTYYSAQGSGDFEVFESVSFGVDSTILIIAGKGFDSQGTKHHDAFGVLYLDPIDGAHRIHAFSMNGQNVIASLNSVNDRSYEWGFDLPNGGKISYSTSFTDTKWEESGTYTLPDGSKSFPIMKMSLSRK